MVPVGGSRADGRRGVRSPGEFSTTGGLMRHASRRAAAEPRGRRYWVGHLAGLLLVAVVAAPLSSFAAPTETRPAEEHLAALRKICLLPCEELGDLEREIAAYRKRTGAGRTP